MQVLIKTITHKTIVCDVDDNTSLSDLKQRVRDETGLCAYNQQFYRNSKPMTDDISPVIQKYKIKDMDTLHVHIRIRGVDPSLQDSDITLKIFAPVANLRNSSLILKRDEKLSVSDLQCMIASRCGSSIYHISIVLSSTKNSSALTYLIHPVTGYDDEERQMDVMKRIIQYRYDEIRVAIRDDYSHLIKDYLNSNTKEITSLDAKRLFYNSMSCNDYEIVSVDDTLNTKVMKRHRAIYNSILEYEYYKKDKNPNEMYLFHATSHNSVEEILHNGFNRDYNKRHLFGKGVYFATKAEHSNQYAVENNSQERVMILCRVIVGDYIKGKSDYHSAPFKENVMEQYDSMVDNEVKPNYYAIVKDYHCLPVFVVKYRAKQN